MLEVFVTAVNAIAPIVLLILLGYFLKRIGFLTKEFLRVGYKLVFNVLLPCMLFINVYDSMADFSSIPWLVVLYCVLVILLLFAIGLLISLLATKKRNRRGVIVQCTFRSNFAIIGLSLVERLGGNGALAGIISAFSIPLFNVLAVVSLTAFQEPQYEQLTMEGLQQERENKGKLGGVKRVLLGIVKNPLIIGVFIGFVFVAVREIERACCGGEVPFRLDTQLRFLYLCVDSLRIIASPFALIVLGGQFEFSAVKGLTKEIAASTTARLVLAPLLGIGLAVLIDYAAPGLLNIGQAGYPTLVALFGTPVAVSSAIMASQMGGDDQLATQLVVWTSIGSIATIFLTVFILMSCGLLAV